MKSRNYLLALVGTCLFSSLSAQQTYFTPMQFFPSDVSNDGVVVGHRDQAVPHELWYPETGKIVKIPQSRSAGEGAAGNATFTEDGTKVATTIIGYEVPQPTELRRTKMFAYPDITFEEIVIVQGNGTTYNSAFMVGTSTDGQKGVVLHSGDGGHIWRPTGAINLGEEFAGGMVSVASLNWTNFIIGGHNGAIYFTTSDGREWKKYTVRPEGNTKEVATYWTIDFMPGAEYAAATYGAFGVEFKDNTYAVWYTEDSGGTLKTATGVNGRPTHISHFADAYYMTTANGHAQKSEDYGKTWEDMFVTENNVPLQRIEFYNETVGMALAKGVVYVTTDGGTTWTKTVVAAGTDDITWNDLLWRKVDGVATATIVGSKNSIYETKDNGATWTAISVTGDDVDANADLRSIAANDKNLSICGAEGTCYWKSYKPTISAATPGIYDIASQEWTTVMKSLGYASDGISGAPFSVSANGEYVLGSIYTYESHNENSAVQSHAAVWTKDGEVIDLGSKFADRNRSTRASACSADGSVIVGHQDIWGPWYACVWRRQSDGTYKQKLMFKDSNTTEDDIDFSEFTTAGHNSMIQNCLGMSRAVSLDGKWIAGRGEPNQTAVGSPWIWSEETGLILLDETGNWEGVPVYVNNEGTVVIGYGNAGAAPWIWRKGQPIKTLNDFATELGVNLKGYYLVGAYNVSRNGRYVAGACMKGEGKFGYMLDMLGGGGNGIESVAMEQCRATVYPNPVSDELHVDLPYSDVKTNIRLLSQQGMMIKQMTALAVSNTMNLQDVPAGLYILDVEVEGVHKTFKIEVVH